MADRVARRSLEAEYLQAVDEEMDAKYDAGFASAAKEAVPKQERVRSSVMRLIGANIEAEEPNGRTAIMIAAAHGLAPLVRALVCMGSEIERRDHAGRTALIWVARGESDTYIPSPVFMALGQAIPAPDDAHAAEATPPAHVGTFLQDSGGQIETARALVELRADLEARDWNGATPLIEATAQGNEPLVRALIALGADTGCANAERFTPLMLAAANADALLVRSLVELRCSLEARDSFGSTTPILVAKVVPCTDWHVCVMEILAEAGANLGAQDDRGFTAPMHAAAQGHAGLIRSLTTHRADLEARDNSGSTALLWAATYGQTSAGEALIEMGAKKDATDYTGATALIVAASQGHVSFVRTLIKAGANADAADIKGNTALNSVALTAGPLARALDELDLAGHRADAAALDAAIADLVAVSCSLVELKADLDKCDNSSNTPLIWAAAGGVLPLVEALIRLGADVCAKNEDGCTALIAAEGFDAVVGLIQQRLEETSQVPTPNTLFSPNRRAAARTRLKSLIAPRKMPRGRYLGPRKPDNRRQSQVPVELYRLSPRTRAA
mmetsp:Transcript_101463/g.286221  ORF Transcript_101463/g.286221 Transcript_101463/m.286221 type:complete len:558 (-) Transcript_101463:136-1809(-)|eukprot:CAMPEP_0117507556 /NCGR_PEP_ID=MMETSP0784-20121206/26483_1 /TAXON_ID=39447 /ORGANISM="" /LENGTH=557 /DNA_ID=CAMNT_0005303061 /DNA_START=97 /DNA_END=1770 /DNA_ORIENTATION=-